MRLVTIGPEEQGVTQMGDAIWQAKKEQSDPPQAAVLFLPFEQPAHYDLWLSWLERELECPVIGATHGSAAFTERGFSTKGAVLGIFFGKPGEVQTRLVTGLSGKLDHALEQSLRSIEFRRGAHHAVFALFDPMACSGDALVKSMRGLLQPACQLFGGAAGDGWQLKGPLVFGQGRAQQGALALLAFNFGTELIGAVRHGWTPIESQTHVVTSASGNEVRRIDERPAVDVYSEVLSRHHLLKVGDDPIKVFALHSLGMKSIFSHEIKVRTPMRLGPGGSVICAGDIPESTEIFFMKGGNDAMIEAARELCGTVRAAKANPSGAIVVDCAGRYLQLGARYGEQIQAFVGDRSVPTLGFTSYGEVAKFRGQIEGFHNTTAVMSMF
ncbi:MAG: FIST C-terminal domain-containing protein [Myxococcota bacterium]|jgi:hypothetical protein|nr:FIST C-terminal domain-containing protein [Myxococcota bacterium]